MKRPKYDPRTLKATLEWLEDAIDKKIKKHGDGVYVSDHETLGILTEEYYELIEEIKRNNSETARQEMMDVAVAAIFGIVSNWDRT